MGNAVLAKGTMGWDKETQSLSYVWNMRNTAGRYAGGGSYMVLIHATPYRGEDRIRISTQVLKLPVGIKRSF